MAKKEKQPWNPYSLAVLKVEGLTACAKSILIYLGARSNYKGETCVGHRTMCRELVRSKGFVTEGLKELEEKGLVKEARRGRKKGEADWRTISDVVLQSRTTKKEMQSYPVGLISPTEQDYNEISSPTQQGETLQIDSKTLNLTDSNPSNLAEERNNNNRVVDVVPQTIAGFTPEAIAEHVAKFPKGSWVWQNATKDALKREGFVKHVMSLEPPKKPLRMKSNGTPLPSYRQESHTVLKGDI